MAISPAQILSAPSSVAKKIPGLKLTMKSNGAFPEVYLRALKGLAFNNKP